MTGLEQARGALAAMLGSFGVAPKDGQAISTFTLGEHGGNKDWRGFGRASTSTCRVFVPGALFHLGDGHACQGDGEIMARAWDESMDVTFTVESAKGWTIGWPTRRERRLILRCG